MATTKLNKKLLIKAYVNGDAYDVDTNQAISGDHDYKYRNDVMRLYSNTPGAINMAVLLLSNTKYSVARKIRTEYFHPRKSYIDMLTGVTIVPPDSYHRHTDLMVCIDPATSTYQGSLKLLKDVSKLLTGSIAKIEAGVRSVDDITGSGPPGPPSANIYLPVSVRRPHSGSELNDVVVTLVPTRPVIVPPIPSLSSIPSIKQLPAKTRQNQSIQTCDNLDAPTLPRCDSSSILIKFTDSEVGQPIAGSSSYPHLEPTSKATSRPPQSPRSHHPLCSPRSPWIRDDGEIDHPGGPKIVESGDEHSQDLETDTQHSVAHPELVTPRIDETDYELGAEYLRFRHRIHEKIETIIDNLEHRLPDDLDELHQLRRLIKLFTV